MYQVLYYISTVIISLLVFTSCGFAKNPSFVKHIIGYSVLKNPIIAYQIGTGKYHILVYSGIHGDEPNSVKLAWHLMDQIQRNELLIPDDIKLTVVPLVNPDGFIFHSRLNANGVDLNRNFPTATWKKIIYISGHRLPFGGGTKPASEPETLALINFFQEKQPAVSISYHSQAGFIYPEMADPVSVEIADLYAKGSGLPQKKEEWNELYYPVTGSFAQWIMQIQKKHTILVEHQHKNTIDAKELLENMNGLRHLFDTIGSGKIKSIHIQD